METLMPWTQVARPGPDLSGQRAARGLAAHASGHSAERRVAAEYEGRGCVVLESCWRSAAGEVDLIAIVAAGSVAALDAVLDRIGELDGVERTQTSVILATKVDRSSA